MSRNVPSVSGGSQPGNGPLASIERGRETASASADDQEASTAQQMMKASAVMGRQAVQDGKADCKIVEASFTKLETIEQQQPMDEDQQQDQQP